MRPEGMPERRPIDGVHQGDPVTVSGGPKERGINEVPPESPQPVQKSEQPTHLSPQPIDDGPPAPKKHGSWRRKIAIIIIGLVTILGALFVGAYAWYQQQLAPVSEDTSKHIRVTIKPGTMPSVIAGQLQDAGVIRSQTAFAIYTKLSGTQGLLKAGTYNLQPSVSTPAIVEHLVSGKQDTFRLTFLPGDTLANNRKKIIEMGYSADEVDAALNKSYDRPLFTGKPAGADLEGYIFGETYEFTADVSVETILNRTFDEYEAFIDENDLVDGFKRQGLTLFEGITLASIVQKESIGEANDQRQIARVFFNRIKAGMTLGSDVTYQYIADKNGVARDVNLDSPYNTRRYPGLPPGPIAVPGVGALRGVAAPADNDYLFFLSGDDDVTYFAKTDAEHQQNIAKHCQKKCLIL